ncbi:hypothetical protein GCM10027275_24620 [Rhabdobacter roseus]|uniref:Uncharacterized protein n=1 Tax=Rhabdobacter roseus TaxID=1655419 RepID=A0A840TS61_9BACT|nr:hypothetical protein [Rhabdobacter roseus]MBB5284402.1 hypothetical protein [Rhabdobacter roseus]
MFAKSTAVLLLSLSTLALTTFVPAVQLQRSVTIDSLGACQGVAYLNKRVYLYGDREVGMIREYRPQGDSLAYTRREVKLTIDGQDVINHPTGLAYHPGQPTFIGNSIRLNPEGTLWKAVIYAVDWEGLLKMGTLDGNLRQTIDDDACIQGTRPEYVQYRGKPYVATADYGNRANEVRLYDPEALRQAKRTSEKGVLFKKFSCGAWVQNLHWIPEKNILVLIQNQIEGRRWRFTYLDFPKSVETGQAVVLQIVDLAPTDELEGFALVGTSERGIAVSSARRNNVHFTKHSW